MRVKVSSLTHHPKNKEIYDLILYRRAHGKCFRSWVTSHPITIDTRNQVIRGNRRFESIKRLGWIEDISGTSVDNQKLYF